MYIHPQHEQGDGDLGRAARLFGWPVVLMYKRGATLNNLFR